MSTSVKSLIHSALRKLGAVSAGLEPSAEEYADGIAALRQMLDAWSLEDLMIPFRPTEQFDLSPDRNIYSMGLGGDWHTTRPEAIEIVRLKRADGTTVAVLPSTAYALQDQTWIPTGGDPDRYILNKDGLFHFIEFNAYPTAPHVLVTSLKPFNATVLDDWTEAYDPAAQPEVQYPSGFQMTGIHSPLSFPTGFEMCIVYNLAIHLAPEYPGLVLPQETIALAASAKSNVKRRNNRAAEMTFDRALTSRRGHYDVNIGPVR